MSKNMSKNFLGDYLVIGSEHKGEVESFRWHDNKIKNLSFNRFNTIIINFLSIPNNQAIAEQETLKVYSAAAERGKYDILGELPVSVVQNLCFLDTGLINSQNKENLNVFFLVGSTNQLSLKLFNTTIFIEKSAIDKYNIKTSSIQKSEMLELGDLYLEFFDQTYFNIVKEANVSMINPSDIVSPYFDVYQYFDFVFQSQIRFTPLAHTFYNSVVSMQINIHGIETIILPHPKLVTPYDATEIVLRRIVGIQDEDNLIIPDWVNEYNSSRQEEILKTIRQISSQIESLQQQIDERKSEFNIIRDFQRVLFTKGKILYESILEIFKTLDLNVKPLRNSGLHDLEIETKENIIVIQIVELEGKEIDRRTVRQLNQFVEMKEEKIDFSKNVKGVLIPSYEVGTNPADKDSLVLDEVTSDYVNKNNLCILTPYKLYTHFQLIHDKKSLSKEFFLSKIVEKNGIFGKNTD